MHPTPKLGGYSAFALVDPADIDVEAEALVPMLVLKVAVEDGEFEVATVRAADGTIHRVPAGLLIQI